MATRESAALMPREPGTNRFAPRDPSDANVIAAKEQWLAAVQSGASVREASKQTGIHIWTAFRWGKEDPEFAAAWDVARESAGHDIEAAMIRRAVERDDMPAVISGLAYLKRLWPHLYVERHIVVTQESPAQAAIAQVLASLRARGTVIDGTALPVDPPAALTPPTP